ncbi:MAG: hypothetical protein KUG71_02550 [Porticoccaceae bacterium]|nr:hypothetical protein [Porticoccaceae bacterium]
MKYPWQNILYIDPLGKTIPYQAPQAGDNEATEFINLKEQTHVIDRIADIQGDIQLRSALVDINGQNTEVFTVGCHAEKIANDDGHQASGYLEFAVNEQSLVSEAATYFALYFQFQNRLALSQFQHAVKFEWVILPAVFTAISLQGFTCSIKINTAWCPTQADSEQAWTEALALVTTHLVEVDQPGGRNQTQVKSKRIY